MTGGSTKASGPSIEVAARGLALARRDTRGSGNASGDPDARRSRGCRRSRHRHPPLAAADDDQPPGLGETPDTRRLEPLPLHLDRRRNLPGVIEGLDLPMSGAMEASRTGETAGSNGLSEMARGRANAADQFAQVRGRSFSRPTERGARFRDLHVHELAIAGSRLELRDSGPDRRFPPGPSRRWTKAPLRPFGRRGASLVSSTCSR